MTPDPTEADFVFPVVHRKWPGPDAAMSPGEGCLDCFVGEPHCCPLLEFRSMHVTLTESGGYVTRTV